MKRWYQTVMMCLISFTTFAYAENVSKTDVQKIASAFLNQQCRKSSQALHKKITKSIVSISKLEDSKTGDLLAHIVNIEPKGFIIFSNDTDLEPIIAYSFTQNWSADTSSANALYHMIQYDLKLRTKALLTHVLPQTTIEQNRLEWQNRTNNEPFQQWPQEGSTNTGGWVETEWHQSSPFNDFCPLDPQDQSRSIVGCTATALAQIIHYHKYIGGCAFDSEDEYVSLTQNIHIDADSASLDFPSFARLNQCLDSLDYKYQHNIPPNEKDLAALNFACGISTEMDYSSYRSGAFVTKVPEALTTKFHYFSAKNKQVTENDFYSALIANMMNALPVELSIADQYQGNAHAIVCDGYNSDDFYHLNFGWAESTQLCWYLLPEGMPSGYCIIKNGVFDILAKDNHYLSLQINPEYSYLGAAVIADTSLKQNIQLENQSDSTIHVNWIRSTHCFNIKKDEKFGNNLTGFDIAPGEKDSLSIVCIPDSVGLLQGQVLVNYSVSEKEFTRVIMLQCYSTPSNATIINKGELHGTLTKTHSPYYVIGEIAVKSGDSLKIEPGCRLYFFPFSFTIGENTQLCARGTASDSIYFTAVDTSQGWFGLDFYESADDDTLSYCNIAHATAQKTDLEYHEDTPNIGIFCKNSSPFICHNTICYNKSDYYGGGILCKSNSSPTICYNIIRNNRAGMYGGGIYCAYDSAPIIQNNIISNNIADNSGGGIGCRHSSSFISNNIIVNNEGKYFGGGINSSDSYIQLINNTICNNTSRIEGAGFNFYDGTTMLSNNIIRGNKSNSDSQIGFRFYDDSNTTISYCNIEGDWQNMLNEIDIVNFDHNMDVNPLFVNGTEGPGLDYDGWKADWHLQADSPCIDAGNPNDPIAAESFPHRYLVNLGAYGGTDQATKSSAKILTITPTPLDFGILKDPEEKELLLYLKNGTLLDIQINEILSSNPEHFSIFSFQNSGEPGMDIKSGAIDSILVKFTSTDPIDKTYIDSLILKVDGKPDQTIPLRAEVIVNTPITGKDISGTWTKANSPYCIYTNIAIPQGQSLTIEPGVEVRFMGRYWLQVGVDAQLRAMGSESDSVRFWAPDTTTGWGGIDFIESGRDDTLAYCFITHSKGKKRKFDGGGIYIDSCAPTITHCRISGNKGISGGGLLCKNNSEPTITFTEITNNITTSMAGAIDIRYSSPFFQNCLLSCDSSEVIYCVDSSPSFCNVTLTYSDNVAIDMDDCEAFFHNSIIWPKQRSTNESSVVLYKTTIEFTYSAVDTTRSNWLKTWRQEYHLSWGTGTIFSDPLFTAPLQNNFTLQNGSPCIDAGDPGAQFNDPEEPYASGQALFPAGGTLRNDMGYYGGGVHNILSNVNVAQNRIPQQYALSQNYPNPFNQRTIIQYQLPEKCPVQVTIHNLLGQQIKTLVEQVKDAGTYKVTWDGTNESGQQVSSGVYIYRIKMEKVNDSKKLILLR